MTKHLEDIKAILAVFSIIVVILTMSIIDFPNFTWTIWAIWLALWIFNIYDKIKYRKNRPSDEIRLPTQNDIYSKSTSIFLGLFFLAGSIVWIIIEKHFTCITALGILSGGLVFTNGILDLPHGKIKVKKHNLRFSKNNQKMPVDEIHLIEIEKDKLLIYDRENKLIRLDNLALTEEWTIPIAEFLKLHLDVSKIKIIYGHPLEIV